MTASFLPADQSSTPAFSALRANRWFANLSLKQQQTLLSATRRMMLREGQLFATQGGHVRRRRDGFGVLVQGLLKVSSSNASGREAILGYVRPGQWFGEVSVLDADTRERDITALSACEIWVIEEELMQPLLQDAELLRHITHLLASRTRHLLSLVEDFTLRSSRARTARRLLFLAYDDEPQVGAYRTELDVSQDALASMLGMTRQSVAAQLRHLSERGAIQQAYGRVTISSLVALMAEAAAA